jgi:hypothetical protein
MVGSASFIIDPTDISGEEGGRFKRYRWFFEPRELGWMGGEREI